MQPPRAQPPQVLLEVLPPLTPHRSSFQQGHGFQKGRFPGHPPTRGQGEVRASAQLGICLSCCPFQGLYDSGPPSSYVLPGERKG